MTGRVGADGGVSGREPGRLLCAVRSGRAVALGLLSLAVKMAARGGAAGPEAAVSGRPPSRSALRAGRGRGRGAGGERAAGCGVGVPVCVRDAGGPRASERASARRMGGGATSQCGRVGRGDSEHVGARGAPGRSREGPAHRRARPRNPRAAPGAPEGGHVVGTIARRTERSQTTRVSAGAKRAAHALFQTPKNQIKQKKMAPPPKKFEESEEEESSDLEESSGEEVIDLKMESKGCTCYRNVMRVVGYTVTGH